jgi:hypothetical protein
LCAGKAPYTSNVFSPHVSARCSLYNLQQAPSAFRARRPACGLAMAPSTRLRAAVPAQVWKLKQLVTTIRHFSTPQTPIPQTNPVLLGCCPLNCAHVLDYSVALSRVWPDLEQTMRSNDLTLQLSPDGTRKRQTASIPFIHCTLLSLGYLQRRPFLARHDVHIHLPQASCPAARPSPFGCVANGIFGRTTVGTNPISPSAATAKSALLSSCTASCASALAQTGSRTAGTTARRLSTAGWRPWTLRSGGTRGGRVCAVEPAACLNCSCRSDLLISQGDGVIRGAQSSTYDVRRRAL